MFVSDFIPILYSAQETHTPWMRWGKILAQISRCRQEIKRLRHYAYDLAQTFFTALISHLADFCSPLYSRRIVLTFAVFGFEMASVKWLDLHIYIGSFWNAIRQCERWLGNIDIKLRRHNDDFRPSKWYPLILSDFSEPFGGIHTSISRLLIAKFVRII